MLDYGYGSDEEREFAEAWDDDAERALRILMGWDEPYVLAYHPVRLGGARDDERESSVRIQMVDPQGQLLREIADEQMTRKDVALTYAFAICQADVVDFHVVNQAIIDRWSMAALKYIKERAWKLIEGKATA